MNPFTFERADAPEAAVKLLAATRGAKPLGGGTNLIDLMKQGVEQPPVLVDINAVELAEIAPLPNGGLRLGATARNADTAAHPLVRRQYPMVAQAILAGASAQLRNMATNGGNMLQRTRCYYFYDPAYQACNKRNPGSGCAAIAGFNRIHAILGAQQGENVQCIATHPSDMAVALAAFAPTVRVRGPKGERHIAYADFHRLPGTTPQLDTNLKPDELILSIDLPPSPFGGRQHYLKVRDRASYAFALVSVAAALELDGDTIKQARIAMGGVAHKPWRAEEAEHALKGKPATEASFQQAAELAVAGAKTYEHNAFKVPMAKAAIVRALTQAQEEQA